MHGDFVLYQLVLYFDGLYFDGRLLIEV